MKAGAGWSRTSTCRPTTCATWSRSSRTSTASTAGEPFPQDPREQLDAAIRAVFESWDNRRARDYRRLNRIDHDLGTAVNVQQMVFGNTGPNSGTGVAFTRNNVTGEKAEPFGDFLINAQGEDVVAGIRTPRPLVELKDEIPEAYAQLIAPWTSSSTTYRNMQDVEFTIEDGALYMLQTRNGKRSAQAMARIAVDLVAEGVLSEQEALVSLVEPDQVRQLLLPQLDLETAPEPLAQGRQRLAGRGRRRGRASPPTRPSASARPASTSSWCATRPPPTTSTGWSRRRASSPPAAARPATPRSSPWAWASRPSAASPRSASSTTARSRSATRPSARATG